MTIEVRIENKSKDRVIEIHDVDYYKEGADLRQVTGPKREIKPGFSETVYVHQTRDIVISEPRP
jgi:hypothetical protein